MAQYERDFVLPDIPPFNPGQHADLFLEALSIAASYGTDGLKKQFPMGVYAHLSGYWRGAKPGDAEYRIRRDNDEEVRRFRDRAVRERAVEVIRRARRTDEQSIAKLREAKADWDRCRGQGSAHPCPCWDKPCTRV